VLSPSVEAEADFCFQLFDKDSSGKLDKAEVWTAQRAVCCIVLYCIVLYYIVLCCVVLCCAVLCCVVLYCVVCVKSRRGEEGGVVFCCVV
jgi:hypothetical protein